MSKVVAVVVTYNRKDCLSQTLNSIQNQTRSLDCIVVIDNASTDGTSEFLHDNGFLGNPRIQYVRMETNTGGAGGFSEGVVRAVDLGADWVWMMDDDVAPVSTCLEELLKWSHLSECLNPVKKNLNGEIIEWEHYLDVSTGRSTPLYNMSFANGKDIAFVNVACFEGLLVSKNLISKIGVPDKKYFLVGDDATYGLLASLYTNVAYIKNAIIVKLISTDNIISGWKMYYMFRNKFYTLVDYMRASKIRFGMKSKVFFVVFQVMSVAMSVRYGFRSFIFAMRGFLSGLYYMLINI